MAQAGKVKRIRTDPSNSSKGKDKETLPPTNPAVPSPGSQAQAKGPEVEAKANVNGKGKKKVAGDEEKEKGKPEQIADVDISKGGVKVDGPGDKKKGDAGQDTKKPGEGVVDSSNNVTPVVVDAASGLDAPTATTNKDDATKEKITKPKDGVEPTVPDEGDATTPKRLTKELPTSPAKSLKEKLAPALGLTVPKSLKDGSAPPSADTVTGSSLSPLQKVLKDTEDETLMERMARLKIVEESRQPPKDVVPPANTDLESEFECETAPSGPSTPRSRAGRGSFSLILRSDVPLSDDDEFFLDCDSNASVSNFDGV